MEVAEKQVALQEISVVPLGVPRAEAEGVVVVGLKPLADVPAERQVGAVAGSEGDVLNGVPEVGPPGWVLEEAVVFLVTEELVRGRTGGGGRDRAGHGLLTGPEPRNWRPRGRPLARRGCVSVRDLGGDGARADRLSECHGRGNLGSRSGGRQEH